MILVPHDPTWADQFAALRDVYVAALGDLLIGVEHIGSTAIPEIHAKPFIATALRRSGFQKFAEGIDVIDYHLSRESLRRPLVET